MQHKWNEKKRILGLAMVLYFTVYASSPLIYIDKKHNSSLLPNTQRSTSSYSTDLRIFLYELICSTLSSGVSTETQKPIAGILLLKKRAVLSEDKVSTLFRLVDISNLDEYLPFYSGSIKEVAINSLDHKNENCARIYSGLSPPQNS